MCKILDEIENIGIVPVIALDNAADAAPLAKALCDGGLPCAEVTFRTACAEQSIKIMTKQFPNMLVGAGTILTTAQADCAVDAGAKFIVSPGLNKKVVAHCISRGIPIIPGCANPSDIEQALELGLSAVKFFPAEAAGGIAMIKAMSAPYGAVKFMPTGGIGENNLLDYLGFSKVIACGGSFMVNKDLLDSGNFDEIAALTKKAVVKMLGFEIAHVGINAPTEPDATALATSLQTIFGFSPRAGSSSIFAGDGIEIMKSPYLGAHGHIAIKTNFIKRAIYSLKKRGVEFDDSTAKFNAKGDLVAIYLKQDFQGFALHLLQK